MLVLTQGAGPHRQGELSPYSVAFIAFLSGFMAEDAFTKIQEAGLNLFKPKEKIKEAAEANAAAQTVEDPGNQEEKNGKTAGE